MSEKTYRVVSKAPQLGHKHGEEFTAEIPEAKEQRMINRGAIEIVTGDTGTTTEEQKTPEQLEAEAKAKADAEEAEAKAKAEAEAQAQGRQSPGGKRR